MKKLITTITTMSLAALLVSCDNKDKGKDAHGHDHNEPTEGGNHPNENESGDDHDHREEVELGEFDIQGHKVQASQSHGNVEAGKEGHLVIKLPYQDNGESVIRAWIGTKDRTLSTVGKGVYACSHDDYDAHMLAPDPLPEGSKWWLEIEKPDDTKAVGSFPLLGDIAKE